MIPYFPLFPSPTSNPSTSLTGSASQIYPKSSKHISSSLPELPQLMTLSSFTWTVESTSQSSSYYVLHYLFLTQHSEILLKHKLDNAIPMITPAVVLRMKLNYLLTMAYKNFHVLALKSPLTLPLVFQAPATLIFFCCFSNKQDHSPL